jgi:hypothetical protein
MYDDGEGPELWGEGRAGQKQLDPSMHRFMEVEGIHKQTLSVGDQKSSHGINRYVYCFDGYIL